MMKTEIETLLKQHDIDRKLLCYGFLVFKQYAIYLAFVLPFVIISDMTVQFMFFLFIFVPIRRYLGGYHFDKMYLCTLFSIIFTLLILYVSVKIKTDSILICNIICLSCICILVSIGPVDHKNKRITEKDFAHYRRKIILTLVSEYMLYNLLFFIKLYTFCNLILLIFLFCVLNILLVKIQGKY